VNPLQFHAVESRTFAGSSAIDTQARVMEAAMLAATRSRRVIMGILLGGRRSLPSGLLWLQYARPNTFGASHVGSKLEEVTEKALFASRWILAPIFLGLSLALIALGFKFFQQAWHIFGDLIDMSESNLVLTVLAMIDIVLVGSLIIMVMFSGYENFVSTIDSKGTDSLSWLGKLDAGTLKLKVAASIVAISSIHLLRIFMQIGDREEQTYTSNQIMWYVIVHMTFVVSAVLLGVLDKMSFAKHR
jgi:uncharacterized protein (TIGR00645 family)